MGRRNEWLGGRDSNPDSQIQSLVSYPWTTSQQRTRIYVSRPANVNRVVSRIAGGIFIAANTGYSLLSSLQSSACSSRVVPPRSSTGNIKLSFVGKTKLDPFTLGRALIADNDNEAGFAVRLSGLRW